MPPVVATSVATRQVGYPTAHCTTCTCGINDRENVREPTIGELYGPSIMAAATTAEAHEAAQGQVPSFHRPTDAPQLRVFRAQTEYFTAPTTPTDVATSGSYPYLMQEGPTSTELTLANSALSLPHHLLPSHESAASSCTTLASPESIQHSPSSGGAHMFHGAHNFGVKTMIINMYHCPGSCQVHDHRPARV